MAAQVHLVLCVLVTADLVSGQVHHIPIVRMEAADDTACPSDVHLDAVKSQLFKKISSLLYTCGGVGWKRVAFLNMSESNQTCPEQ